MNEWPQVFEIEQDEDPKSLAEKLTARSKEGWTVVAIVPAAGGYTAFVRKNAPHVPPPPPPPLSEHEQMIKDEYDRIEREKTGDGWSA